MNYLEALLYYPRYIRHVTVIFDRTIYDLSSK